ncbi:MAG: helix-turn-helix domain-containing protein [Rhodospirillales bacterium]
MTKPSIDDLIADLRRDDGYDEAFEVVRLVRAAGDLLARMRERRGLTQTELAVKLGVTPGRIWQLESGTLRNAPNLKTIARWARACGEAVDIAASGDRVPNAPAVDVETIAARAVETARGRTRGVAAVPIATVGVIDPRAVAVAATAVANALAMAGLGHVGVAAGTPRRIGDRVELRLILGPETPVQEIETG